PQVQARGLRKRPVVVGMGEAKYLQVDLAVLEGEQLIEQTFVADEGELAHDIADFQPGACSQGHRVPHRLLDGVLSRAFPAFWTCQGALRTLPLPWRTTLASRVARCCL